MGVRFSDTLEGIRSGIHTYNDWGALLAKQSISSPTPKTYKVDVPFHNGALDLTNVYASSTFYSDREISITLKFLDVYERWAYYYSLCMNELHGKKKYICLDEDSRYYYYGRVTVDQFNTNRFAGTITLRAEVEPYKMEIDVLQDEITVDGEKRSAWIWDTFSFVDGVIYDISHYIRLSGTFIAYNIEKPVKPLMRSTTACTVTSNGKEYSLKGDNEWHEMGFYLLEGENQIAVRGDGDFTVGLIRRGGKL